MRGTIIGILILVGGCELTSTEPLDTGLDTVPITGTTTTTTTTPTTTPLPLCPTVDLSLMPPPGGYVKPGSWITQGYGLETLPHPDGFGADVMNERDILLSPAVMEIDITSTSCRIDRASLVVDESACPDCTEVEFVDDQNQSFTQTTLSNGLSAVGHSISGGDLVLVRVTSTNAVVGPLRLNF